MPLDQQIDAAAHSSTHRFHDLDGMEKLLIVHVEICLAKGVPLEGRDAHCHSLFGGSGKLVRLLCTGKPDVGIHAHTVAHLAAQQLVQRHLQGLGLDVPHGNVQCRNGALQHRAHTPVGVAVQFVADPFHLTRILADQHPLQVFNGTQKGMFLVFQRAFANAGNAFVGLNLHKHIIRAVGINIKGFDICDLQTQITPFIKQIPCSVQGSEHAPGPAPAGRQRAARRSQT